MKYVIWGCGKNSQLIVSEVNKSDKEYECIGFVDSDNKKWNKYFLGIPVYSV